MNLTSMFEEFGLGLQAQGTTLTFVNLTGGGGCDQQQLRNTLTLANGEFLKGVRKAGFEKLKCAPDGPAIDVPY